MTSEVAETDGLLGTGSWGLERGGEMNEVVLMGTK